MRRCRGCKKFLASSWHHSFCRKCRKLVKLGKLVASAVLDKNPQAINETIAKIGQDNYDQLAILEQQTEAISVPVGMRGKISDNKQLWIFNGMVYCAHENYANLCDDCKDIVAEYETRASLRRE